MLSTPQPQPVILRKPVESFAERHIGPRPAEVARMLAVIASKNPRFRGKRLSSVEQLVDCTVPQNIRLRTPLRVGGEVSESAATAELRRLAKLNAPMRSFIGQGYYNAHLPAVLRRNVLENPGWYTPYTPYQAEISQGRLEAMLTFQTMVGDLTGFGMVTSLLDEATAGAEAMAMCRRLCKGRRVFHVDRNVHRHVVDVIRTRAAPLGVEVVVGDARALDAPKLRDACGVYVQYPDTFGAVADYGALAASARAAGAKVVAGVDLMALALYRPPSEWGADIVVGSNNRFGLPAGNGGPHSGILATSPQYQRSMPGRLIGVSKDAAGAPALRMALQTREQHIKREHATSNICTSTALVSALSGFYGMYHGPQGLANIAGAIRCKAHLLGEALRRLGVPVAAGETFDTVFCPLGDARRAAALQRRCRERGINVREIRDGVSVSLDETATLQDVQLLVDAFAEGRRVPFTVAELARTYTVPEVPAAHRRTTPFMTHRKFSAYHSEHAMTRYLHELQSKDVGLQHHMIPLGSCTMKLNAAAIMAPLTWAEFADVHPFAPEEQKAGYGALVRELERMLAEITQMSGCSLQPTSGAAGEYAGMLTVRNYLNATGQGHRRVCLVPQSAHGTNPASCTMAGFDVVVVKCDAKGYIDVADFKRKAAQYKDTLGCTMITYPSTYGLFEEGVRELVDTAHLYGAQVYMDGANMNAQVGLTAPGRIGADVCHLNLHKTFAMPHGGGGPGVGPICCARHLVPYLPGHSAGRTEHTEHTEHTENTENTEHTKDKEQTKHTKHTENTEHTGLAGRTGGAVSSAPQGNASLLPISWMYIKMLGAGGLKRATQTAILNSNYMAARLSEHYRIVYTGANGTVGHEFILDCRPFKKYGVEATDIAKRLMDYGFHGPTMSFPVANTLMVEPTESEPLAEIDRFCDALIQIRQEIRDVAEGRLPRDDNPLRNAPHTAAEVVARDWTHPYTRERAAFPLEYVRRAKVWPAVKRVNDTYGDLHLRTTLDALPRHDE